MLLNEKWELSEIRTADPEGNTNTWATTEMQFMQYLCSNIQNKYEYCV